MTREFNKSFKGEIEIFNSSSMGMEVLSFGYCGIGLNSFINENETNE